MKGLLAGFVAVLLMVGLIALVTSAPDDGTESGGAPVPAAQARGTVSMRDRAFEPTTVRALRATAVTFRNRDDEEHGVRFEGDGAPRGRDSIAPGQVATVQAERKGRFKFVCPIHPQMTGTLVVG